MSEDRTRATRSGVPLHGSVGPEDPHADPATDPALRPVGYGHEDRTGDTGDTAPVPVPAHYPADHGPDEPVVTRTRTGGLWTGLILSAIVLVFLLVFILQNPDPVRIRFLGFAGELPTGVALLLAAVAGLLLVAIPGGLRILQLRRAATRAGRR
ncbi:MAG: hypothetical protein AVDCRST_MAG66-1058 [uncultured Pseudonocardia sp.]|uniref:Lipopolysaccharide assembly protein A domain-containing protein n=1 Tax=uncultured Pseudonocardia sp. TaxID=211455 RepID=A0A6J4NPV2_9PSEU|nr:MAG: hypothetical protein AVDCRST_MAG66-1058 [uncultured Pseudonocardia sp.]